jgi:hypothetical protein
MRLYREDRGRLNRLAQLQGASSSGELVLHPPGSADTAEELRPEASALLAYIQKGVRTVSGVRRRLTVARTVRDDGGIHATGWAFDIRRRYASGAQAEAFQYMLDRLQALNLIAWVRDGRLIHITASSEGGELAQ